MVDGKEYLFEESRGNRSFCDVKWKWKMEMRTRTKDCGSEIW